MVLISVTAFYEKSRQTCHLSHLGLADISEALASKVGEELVNDSPLLALGGPMHEELVSVFG